MTTEILEDFHRQMAQEKERHENEHARTKQAIYNWFDQHREQFKIRCSTDFRIEVNGRWHVPDVAVLPAAPEGDEPYFEHWPDAVPDAVFEVFRPHLFGILDLASLIIRLDDYVSQGIEVWLVDHDCSIFFEYTTGSLSERWRFYGGRFDGDPMHFEFEEIRKLLEQTK